MLIPFGAEPGRTAQDADFHLYKKRIIVRQLGSYKLPHALRMTIGLEHENRAVLDALARICWALGMRMTKPMFEQVALIGIGLIGSSLSHAMRRASSRADYGQRPLRGNARHRRPARTCR